MEVSSQKLALFVTSLSFSAFLLSGCSKFYIPVGVKEPVPAAISKAIADGRYFILRDSMFNYSMQNVKVDEKANTITAELGTVPPQHSLYLNARKKCYVFAKTDTSILNEIHLFSDRIISTPGSGYAEIPISSINHIQRIDFDHVRTKRERRIVWFTVGGGIVLAGLVVALIAGSAIAESF